MIAPDENVFGNKCKMLSNVLNTVQQAIGPSDDVQDLEWLDTLAGLTELESLIAIKDELSRTNYLSLDHLDNKINFVLGVDESTYRKVKRVTHNYLIKMKDDKDLRKDVQVVAYDYHRQLYGAYSQILDAYQAQKTVKLSVEKTALLLARYLNAAFMMSKWRYFDDQSAPFGVWKNVHKVIKLAEELAIVNKNIFLYQFQVKETSIAAILKRGFMVDTLHKGNYSQLEIELTDRILKIWATNPLIVNTYKPDRYHFYIKLEGDNGPGRVRFKERFTHCRYWKTTRLIDLMEAYLLAVSMRKSVREFGLKKIAPNSVIVKLLKKLRKDWCVEGYQRQRRNEKRGHINTLIRVNNGLEAVHKNLMRIQEKLAKESAEASGFTFELKKEGESRAASKQAPVMSPVLGAENLWMVDESKSGFAVDFGKDPADWVEVGALVGYREDGYQRTLTMAEIKSVRKLSNGTYRAGFKKISHNLIAVQASSVSKATVSEPVSGFYLNDSAQGIDLSPAFSAVLVDNNVDNSPKLLVPRKVFKRGRMFNVVINEEDHLVKAGKVIAKHNDWVLFDALL